MDCLFDYHTFRWLYFPRNFLCRQLLLCRVALGKSFLQFNAMKMAHAPPGHHSVVGRPSVGGLSFPEYVVYRGEQVINELYTKALDFSELIRQIHKCFDLIEIFKFYRRILNIWLIIKLWNPRVIPTTEDQWTEQRLRASDFCKQD